MWLALGADDFAAWLAAKLARPGRPSERARERRETDEQLAERLVREGLAAARWTEQTLHEHPKNVSAILTHPRRPAKGGMAARF